MSWITHSFKLKKFCLNLDFKYILTVQQRDLDN